MSALMFSIVVLGVLCTVTTLSLLAYRLKLTYREDTSIHVSVAESGMVEHQMLVDHRLHWIDRVGPILTVLVVVFGMVLTFVYIYVPWAEARLAA
jgi:hypothetical protein